MARLSVMVFLSDLRRCGAISTVVIVCDLRTDEAEDFIPGLGEFRIVDHILPQTFFARNVDLDLGLAANFIAGSLVGQLLDELVRLNVDILAALKWLGSSNVSSEELFGSCCSCLRLSFGSLLSVVEDLVRVLSSWDDHLSVSTSSEDSPVIHDVLWIVLAINSK